MRPEITTKTSRKTFWSNWSGAVRGVADSIITPDTVEQISDVVLDGRSRACGISVVGSGHSYSDLVAPAGRALIDLSDYDGITAVDRTNMTVTVKSGTTLRELNRQLAVEGLALPNQSAIDEQTVAGAVATATHGSSPTMGTLSSHVVSARVLTADGQIRTITSNDPELDGVRVHLGCLGVVLDLTLSVIPADTLRKVVVRKPLEAVLANLEEFQEVSFGGFWWYPHTSQAVVWTAEPTNEPATSTRGPRSALMAKFGTSGWPSRVASVAHHFSALTAGRAEPQVLRRDDALLHHLPNPLQGTEYSVPFHQAASAIRELVQTVHGRGLRISAPVDVRFTAADSAWLSPSRQSTTCHIGVTHPVSSRRPDAWREPLRAVDALLWEFEGRPHWAKVHFRTGEQLAARYPQWKRFQELRRAWDPEGIFLGDHLRTLLTH